MGVSANTVARMWLVLAIVLAVGGWGAFAGAIIHSSAYTVSHPMRGFEWVWGVFIVPVAYLGLCYMPRPRTRVFASPEEMASYDNEVNCRLVWVLLFTLGGVVATIINAVLEWIAPPGHTDDTLAAFALTHVSPTPSFAPTHHSPVPDYITGSLMCAQSVLLAGSVACAWVFVRTPTQADRSDSNDDF